MVRRCGVDWLEPDKETKMEDNELRVRGWRIFSTTIIAVVASMCICTTVNAFHVDNMNLQLRQMDFNDNVRAAADARKEEAKAVAEKLMRETMLKNCVR